MAETSLHTVKVTFSGFSQDNKAISGKFCLKLSNPINIDNKIIVPSEWQTASFGTDGTAVLEVIPNAIISTASTYAYKVQIYASACLKTIQEGLAYIPDKDCNFAETIVSTLPVKSSMITPKDMTLVGAIFALSKQAKDSADKTAALVGTDTLTTQNKTSVIAAVNEVVSSVNAVNTELAGCVRFELPS